MAELVERVKLVRVAWRIVVALEVEVGVVLSAEEDPLSPMAAEQGAVLGEETSSTP